eukprot:CAMPEP_0203891518 /NCGR_PEP_ID=MMETSP0359-20131031/34792_1 /ASSEMBLY_ACC=CAM_ASM_000338 /TAXON_ID=268821 /ORGANISM="Scrippsiella Hangoei, Strain SHTV-5" /LENGTH=106 /DNA_ID=CAMNT_0050813315 /DNA_START=177 /DNA_END=493 /DNA_ORIENTATION=+
MGLADMMPDSYLVVVVWLLRMVLPCLLFWIGFGPKFRWPFSHQRAYQRADILRLRAASLEGRSCPAALSSLALATERTAPALFQDAHKQEEARDRRDKDRRDRRNA